MGEPNNPSLEGTDNAETSASDTSQDWNYHDPDEDDQDNVEVAGAGETEDEEAAETGESEAEADDDGEEAEAGEVVFTLSDGTKLSRAEVEQGYLRQADYTRKSQEVATRRKSVDEIASRIEGITNAFIDHLTSLVPEEPAYALALTDPAKYTRAKAQYDAAMVQVQKLIEIGQQPKQAMSGLNDQERAERLGEENRLLAAAVPEAAKNRERFFQGVAEVATSLGYSLDELRGVDDHRLFVLAHWAKKGMEADKARTKAQAKAEKAAPTAPRKPGQTAAKANRNVEAMRKLARSGSIRDALKVEWD